MKHYEPQDPRANERGDHPQMGERKGMWKVILVSLTLTTLGLVAAWIWFGA